MITSATRRDFLRACGACTALAVLETAPAASSAVGIDQLLHAEIKARRIPGLAVGVIQDGRLVEAKGYGIAHLEWDAPVSADTIFDLASITKPFTAMLVMMLVEEGKVALGASIGEYLSNAPSTWSGISVRQLLSHSAGITETMGFGARGSIPMDLPTALVFEHVRRQPLIAPPGTRGRYTDQGYFLLGMIIEKMGKAPWAGLLRERIFEPLGMSSTSVLDQWEIVKHRAANYSFREGRLVNARRHWQVELPSPFGILSTVKDLAKWDRAIAEDKLLKRSTFAEMCRPATLNDGRPVTIYGAPYGLGWRLDDLRGRRVVEHGGFTGTHFMRLPEDGLSVIVLTNLDVASGSRPELLARAVAGLYQPALRPPQLLEPTADPEPARTEAFKRYLADVAGGKESPLCTPGHRAWLAEMDAKAREDTGRWLKELKSFSFLACDPVPERSIERLGAPVSHICYYRMATGAGTICWTVYLTSDGKIAQAVPDR
jgi:CubicO group peptidase (beta-lactamase class C family)